MSKIFVISTNNSPSLENLSISSAGGHVESKENSKENNTRHVNDGCAQFELKESERPQQRNVTHQPMPCASLEDGKNGNS